MMSLLCNFSKLTFCLGEELFFLDDDWLKLEKFKPTYGDDDGMVLLFIDDWSTDGSVSRVLDVDWRKVEDADSLVNARLRESRESRWEESTEEFNLEAFLEEEAL